ncbi:MAG: CHAD domain-containing protein, partial [Propionicimonas sp.]
HHAPLASVRLPAELRALVAEVLDGQALFPAAQLRTRRRQAELRGADGSVLAQVCLDDVVATVGRADQSWREVEVELVDGDAGVMDAVTSALAEAGIQPAAGQSKIGRTLAAALRADDQAATGDPSAVAVVLDYLAAQVGTLQELEPGVRVDLPDAVHRSRVATRRLRTALRTFGPLFHADAVARLRAELAWHAAELGAPRDAEVLRDGLLEALDSLGVPPEAQERGLIAGSLVAAHARAHTELVETMATSRYDDLHRLLEEWLADPPLEPAAAAGSGPVLHGLLDRARGRVTRLYARALRDPEDLVRWHEVRKAAKAVRYCAEALEPAFGGRATGHAAAWEAVTDAFGELQDSLVARAEVAGLGTDSPVLDALVAYEIGRGRAELVRGRAALDAALAASL